ncbi:hypothetical protein AVEN_228977-1 [Araneus ventricosus]|uniref:Uncharacterized protein n=1 Tax=Araneus ventricosus TaxID=182803 RepID=A0A4Y2I6A9_ARAVE|nr:hypothetical protein AVEN_228977-1 [Araneus ventricosus]
MLDEIREQRVRITHAAVNTVTQKRSDYPSQSPIAQQTQEISLKSTNIKHGWIRSHVGYSGNEAGDVLAKKATQEGIPTYIPTPRNHIKGLLQKESAGKKNGTMEKQAGVFTTFCLKSRELLLHGKGPKQCSSRATAHSRHTLHNSTPETAIPTAAETWETPYTMLQAVCLQLHIT